MNLCTTNAPIVVGDSRNVVFVLIPLIPFMTVTPGLYPTIRTYAARVAVRRYSLEY